MFSMLSNRTLFNIIDSNDISRHFQTLLDCICVFLNLGKALDKLGQPLKVSDVSSMFQVSPTLACDRWLTFGYHVAYL